MIKFSGAFPPNVKIYSLRTNSWKEIPNVVPCKIYAFRTDSVLNGVVHWVAAFVKEDKGYESILSFDMVNEVFGEIKLPECCRGEHLGYSVMVLKELLSLFVGFQEEEDGRVDIWVPKEYGVAESWSKQFT